MIFTAIVYNKDSHGNELTVDEMIKRFKRKVQNEDIMDELKRRECFVPNSVAKQEKMRNRRRANKANNKRDY